PNKIKPINAGISAISIFKKGGKNGNGTLINIKINDNADKIPIIMMFLVLKCFILFSVLVEYYSESCTLTNNTIDRDISTMSIDNTFNNAESKASPLFSSCSCFIFFIESFKYTTK